MRLLILSLMFFSSHLMADAIGLRGHAGFWMGEIKGTLGGLTTELDKTPLEQKNSHPYLTLYLEHPLPLLPNLRAHYHDLKTSQQIHTGTPGAASIAVDLSHADITAYYELLDSVVSLDAGLSVRQYMGEIDFTSVAQTKSWHYDAVLPMAYLLFEVHFPLSGWSLGAEGHFTEFDNYQVLDSSIRLRYLLDAVVKVGLDAGYREMSIDIDKHAGLDLTTRGPFAALAVYF